jgi:hypothetical protein
MRMERSTVVAVFRDRDDAERAVEELHRLGFGNHQIGFMMRHGEGVFGTTSDTDTRVAEGATEGIVAGGLIGGALALAALFVPGVGPVLAGGILSTIIGSAAAGGAVGGVLGMLMGSGIPDEEARFYESEFNEGRVLVTVSAGDRHHVVREALRRHNAYDVEGGPNTARPAVTPAATVDMSEPVPSATIPVGTPVEPGTGASDLRSWAETSPEFRQRWQSRHGVLGGRYEDYEPFYRYGYEMSADPRFENREWTEVEPDLRGEYGAWARTYGYEADDNAWERFKDAAMDSWDSARERRAAA